VGITTPDYNILRASEEGLPSHAVIIDIDGDDCKVPVEYQSLYEMEVPPLVRALQAAKLGGTQHCYIDPEPMKDTLDSDMTAVCRRYVAGFLSGVDLFSTLFTAHKTDDDAIVIFDEESFEFYKLQSILRHDDSGTTKMSILSELLRTQGFSSYITGQQPCTSP
jgi:hypothetical protein